MADQQLMFFSPEQVSDEELATLRSRIRAVKTIPILYGAVFAGGYFGLAQFVLKVPFAIPGAVFFGLGGFYYGFEHVARNYMNDYRTFKNAKDNPDVTSNYADSPYIGSNYEIVEALNRR